MRRNLIRSVAKLRLLLVAASVTISVVCHAMLDWSGKTSQPFGTKSAAARSASSADRYLCTACCMEHFPTLFGPSASAARDLTPNARRCPRGVPPI
jgi:hypothetical protein